MTKLTRSYKRGLQISPYRRLLGTSLALLCLIPTNTIVAAEDTSHEFPVRDSYIFNYPDYDYLERSVWTPTRVLATMMSKQNGHYQKCQGDSHCDMLLYHEWFNFITTNGLQLRYNKDTFKLKQWRLK